MKILIIEDDKSLCTSVNDYLKMEGHICEVARNFQQADLKTAGNRYDCLILDIGLPDCNGLEIIKKLKANSVSEGVQSYSRIVLLAAGTESRWDRFR